MLSNRDACNWCGRVIELLEGKKYCDDCCRCCVRECRTCHKPYPSLKYFAHSDSERCNCCTTRNENQKKKKKGQYTKNESIAMSMKSKKRRDDDGRGDSKMLERSITPPPSLPKKKRRRANPPVDDVSDTASSSYSVSDNESVEEVDLLGEDGNNKTSDYSDNEQEEEVVKKSRQKNNRTVNEMLKAAEDRKKRADSKNPDVSIQQKKKRVYNRRPNTEKTPAQAEKDLMKALVNYKKALPSKAQINVVFVPE